MMKLLTLNTHSLIEDRYEEKLEHFVKAIASFKPDIIALQEVNQTADSRIVAGQGVKLDNHALRVVDKLKVYNQSYDYAWLGIKNGYDKFDEGVAILSRSKIIKTNVITASKTDDYFNWKTRKMLGVTVKDFPDIWFYSVHFGFWKDNDEPFYDEWQRFFSSIRGNDTVWLLGDFNNCATVRNEGYDLVKKSGFYDTFDLAKFKDSGVTVNHKIDGWAEKGNMRIDQIWCNKPNEILESKVIFNGENEKIVSDHFGVMVSVG